MNDLPELLKRQIVNILLLLDNLLLHKLNGFLQQGLLDDPVTLDHQVFRVFPITGEIAQTADHLPCLFAFLFSTGQLFQTVQEILLLLLRFLQALLKQDVMSARLKVFDIAENHGNEDSRLFAEAGPGDIDLTGAAHAVFFKIRPYGMTNRIATFQLGQVLKKSFVIGVLQILQHRRIWPDDIRYIQQLKPHFRCNIAPNRFGKRICRALFAQPLFHFLIKPTYRIYPDINRCHALRVIQGFF